MTSILTRIKKLSTKYNVSLLMLIGFFALVVILGFKAVIAYYNQTLETPIIRSVVADFATAPVGGSDVNIVIYKENAQGVDIPSYGIPAIGYSLREVDCTVDACETTNTNAACYYTINNNAITIHANQRVTCNFYYEPDEGATSDINVYINIEDLDPNRTQKYMQVSEIPAYGFTYVSTSCTNGVTATYNPNTRIFSFETTGKTDCNAYFDSVGTADIEVHVFVQARKNGDVYNEVESIPPNKTYTLHNSQAHPSVCKDGNTTVSTPTYSGGYINVNTNEKAVCNVFLDLVNN